MGKLSRLYWTVEPVVVLGTDDVASAVGHALHQDGIPVLLVRDPAVPVLRRTMAFDAALDDGSVVLAGVRACAARSLSDVMHIWQTNRAAVPVTTLPLDDLLCLASISGIVDARMRRRSVKPDLRPFVPLAIGLGPGFEAGHNVHVAIETAPEATGQIVYTGATLPAHGRSARLGGAGRERFGRAPNAGLWRSVYAIGDDVDAGTLIGFCEETPMVAPLSGRLRGLVRDRSMVAQGTRLLEVDPRGEAAQCSGIPPRAATIAAAVRTVVKEQLFAVMERFAWSQ